MKSQYPLLPLRPTMEELSNLLRDIARLRQTEDLPDFTNLNQNFVTGRSTQRIPSGATDVVATDVLGDIVYALDASYMYILTDNAGTLVWARIALDTAW